MAIKVLDFGCGNGDFVNQLAQQGKDIFGVDIDINQALKKYPLLKFFNLVDKKIPFDDSLFDEVYARDVLEHVEDPVQIIREINRVLKFDGLFYVSIPYYLSEKILLKIRPEYFSEIGHKRIFLSGEIEQLLQDNGFKIIGRKRRKSFLNLVLIILFLMNKGITNQRGDIDNSLLYKALIIINQFFDWEITLQTKAKYFPVWPLCWIIEWLFNFILPKTIVITAKKITN